MVASEIVCCVWGCGKREFKFCLGQDLLTFCIKAKSVSRHNILIKTIKTYTIHTLCFNCEPIHIVDHEMYVLMLVVSFWQNNVAYLIIKKKIKTPH